VAGRCHPNVGGRGSRWLQYCLGRQVGSLLGAGLDDICILCGWYCLCGDVIPLWSSIPTWVCEELWGLSLWSCCSLCAWGPSDIITSTIIVCTGTIFNSTIYVKVVCAEQLYPDCNTIHSRHVARVEILGMRHRSTCGVVNIVECVYHCSVGKWYWQSFSVPKAGGLKIKRVVYIVFQHLR
jgi:hypothetical protein